MAAALLVLLGAVLQELHSLPKDCAAEPNTDLLAHTMQVPSLLWSRQRVTTAL